MDEQSMRTAISILRQKLADLEWQNTLLQVEIVRLTSETPERDTHPTQGDPHDLPTSVARA